MKKIGILGSTGSIGTQTLNVIDNIDDQFQIKYLTTYSNVNLLAKQALKYKPDTICIVDENKKNYIEKLLKNTDINIEYGRNSLLDLASRNDIDLVVNGLVGSAGMEPTINAIKNGVDVALSNKESMVMAGQIINDLLIEKSCKLFPVDSEHNAIWQCLRGENYNEVKRIILTGSGGPFRTKPIEEFKYIKLEEALKHPNWSMGKKITIDSATMMNKGLEVIEAYWLFNINIKQIDIIIHPESIIHSMVEFIDGSVKAQLGLPDMKIPIQYSLTYPNHLSANWENLDLAKIGQLNFEKPNLKKFPCIQLAYNALESGGTSPIILNVANDIVVAAFLNQQIAFNDIPVIIEDAINKHDWDPAPNLDMIFNLAQWTKNYIKDTITTYA